MAKRRAGDKAKANAELGLIGRSNTPIGGPTGKTAVQVQAEKIAEKYFTDMMAGAGVHVDRMALEVLYWLPRDFLDLYQELYMRGLASTDGGTESRGKAAAETGTLGKAKAKTATNTKKYKKYWVVADEHALDMKTRIDKRLRQLTRDIRAELEELDWKRSRGEKVRTKGSGSGSGIRAVCSHCKIVVSLSWRFCPKCGTELEDRRAGETKMRVTANDNRQAG